MGLCGSIDAVEDVEDTVERCDLKEVGKVARPRLILAKCTEDDVLERYTIPLKTISSGNMTGDIVVVRERKTKNEFALKTIQKSNMSEKMLNVLRREVEILASLDHPNVIHCVEIFETPYRISIVLELGDGSDLFDRLQKQPQGRFKPWIASEMVRSMLLALAHCHAHGIVHRDIKLDNFIFDQRGVLKLIDFGLSKQWIERSNENLHNKIKKMNSVVGTLDTIAPEVMSSDVPYAVFECAQHSHMYILHVTRSNKYRYTQKCDMWSLGCVAYALLCGHYPFRGSNKKQIQEQIRKRKKLKMTGSSWRDVPDEAKMFVRQLLDLNPNNRPSATQALNHPWMQHKPPPKDSNLFESLIAIKDFAELDPIVRVALAIFVHFSPRSNKIRDAVFIQMDTDHSGRISKQELAKAIEHHNIECKNLDRVFANIDIDNSERINFTEFLAASAYSSLKREERLKRREVDSIFDRLDLDQTQSISYENMRQVFGGMFREDEIVSFFQREGTVMRAGESPRIHRETFYKMMAFLCEEDEGDQCTTTSSKRCDDE